MNDPYMTREERREVRSAFWYAMRWLLLILVIIGALTLLGWGITYATADVRGRVDANEKIKADGNFRIEAYERFYNQCASVQSIEATITATKAELATATNDRDRTRLRTNLTALTAARADAVNQYNADSRKTYTAGQFKASDLPFQLPTTMEGTTSCDA